MTRQLGQDADLKWLWATRRPAAATRKIIRAVDLFCGSGGMTVGLEEAARRIGHRVDVCLAIDAQPIACRVYKANFPQAPVAAGDIVRLLDGKPGDALTETEQRLAKIDRIDVMLGGPPCEGHSDLNNHTRRRDPKNSLYLRMARAAEVLQPRVLVVENVPPVLRDSENVVDATRLALEKTGYTVHGQIIDPSTLGVPQRRRRYILLASAERFVDPIEVLGDLVREEWPLRDVRWAIGDLKSVDSPSEIDRPSQMSEENQRRVEYLFESGLFDLPNAERPPCHQDEHSYKSMYGRLRWNQPAQTITTGFTSMGQGRFVHPSRKRTLTPHEAARLQTFPDWFDWSLAPGRTALAKLIGNAVPPLLMTRLGEVLLPSLLAEPSRKSVRSL